MFRLWRTSASRHEARSIVAAALMFFFLAEWGTHAVIHIGSHAAAPSAVSATSGTGDDPCHSFVHCDHNGHRDRPVPNTGHDITPNGLVELFADLELPSRLEARPLQPFTSAPGISRPPDPAFHPPERS